MKYRGYLYAVLSGASFGIGWLVPGGVLCAVLGWAAALAFTALLQSDHRYRAAYLSGLVANAVGFYWLVGTIRDFGGYPMFLALCVFALFMAGSAVQYLIVVFAYNHLPQRLAWFGLGAPIAWVIGELVSIRIFPWHAGHMQLAFRPLAQAAALGGSLLLSFIVFWCSEALLRACSRTGTEGRRGIRRLLLPAPLALLLLIGYGYQRLAAFKPPPRQQDIAIVQANISTEQKHNMRFFLQNTARYVELSRQAAERESRGTLLVIWPESVILDWNYDMIGTAQADQRLPYLGEKVALLVGALTFSDGKHFYNSAVAIYPNGVVPPPYHKRILIPFGEYIPFGETFPWLKQFNPMAANGFNPGAGPRVFNMPLQDQSGTHYFLKVSPLICYEDVLQSLGREATGAGAEILVNMTNDAWFGNTAEPYQHHLIAAFRAIENFRYLVRSTNTGLTAVVDPTGVTTAQLPVFSENILYTQVAPLSEVTLYTRIGNAPWLLMLAAWIILAALPRLRGRGRLEKAG